MDASHYRSMHIDQPSLLTLISRAQCDPKSRGIDVFQANFPGNLSQGLDLVNILDEVLSIASPGDERQEMTHDRHTRERQ